MIDFRKTEFIGVAANLGQCPAPVQSEVVLSGRSNVGKSSLINAISDNRHLARVSLSPGKTRLIVYFLVDRKLLLTDLPGYGYAKVSQKTKAAFSQLADQYLTSGRPVALVLHLLDIRHAPSVEDKQMLEWLDASGMPYQIVLTKADKLSRSQMLQRKKELALALAYEDPEKLLIFSAQTKQGVDPLRQLIASLIEGKN